MNDDLKKIKRDTFVLVLKLLWVSFVMALGFVGISAVAAAVMTLIEVGADFFQQELSSTEKYISRWRIIFAVWLVPCTLYTLYFTTKNLYQQAITYSYSKAIALGEMEHPLAGKGVKAHEMKLKGDR